LRHQGSLERVYCFSRLVSRDYQVAWDTDNRPLAHGPFRDHRDLCTVGKPPSPLELALRLRHRALRLCAQGDYGECRDALDEAQKIDPEGDANEPVRAVRAERAAEHATGASTKPRKWLKKRPLQRHP
jgi:hypothetical protein